MFQLVPDLRFGRVEAKKIIMMMIVPATLMHVIKVEKKRGSMDEIEMRRRGILTTGKWCNPVSKSNGSKAPDKKPPGQKPP